jgi:hypothetical protein
MHSLAGAVSAYQEKRNFMLAIQSPFFLLFNFGGSIVDHMLQYLKKYPTAPLVLDQPFYRMENYSDHSQSELKESYKHFREDFVQTISRDYPYLERHHMVS